MSTPYPSKHSAPSGLPRPPLAPSRTTGPVPLPARDLSLLGGRIRRLAQLAAAAHEAETLTRASRAGFAHALHTPAGGGA